MKPIFVGGLADNMWAPGNLTQKIAGMLDELGQGPLMVHSDLLRAGTPAGAPSGRSQLLQAHWNNLKSIAGNRDIWMPVFNYSFPHSQTFDVMTEVSQIGPFTEYFRTELALWRSSTPMISFCGTGQMPPDDPGPEIDPFGPRSTYHHLVQAGGIYLAYGAPFTAANPIHVSERQSGQPLYRYDKYFHGHVRLKDGSQRQVVLRYHARPWKTDLDYDYPRLKADLVDAGICRVWEPGPLRFMCYPAGQLIQYWTERLANDPLYLLNQRSRDWVEPMLEKLGRPFLLTDFEQLDP